MNDTMGRDVSYGSLYLIIGCDKSESRGIASYSDESEESDVSLDWTAAPIAGARGSYAYSWDTCSPATVQVGPDRLGRGQPGKKNQCVFIRGFKISVREGPLAKLFGSVNLASMREPNVRTFLPDKSGIFFIRRGSSTSFKTSSSGKSSASGSWQSVSSEEESETDDDDGIFDNDGTSSGSKTDDDVSISYFPGPLEVCLRSSKGRMHWPLIVSYFSFIILPRLSMIIF